MASKSMRILCIVLCLLFLMSSPGFADTIAEKPQKVDQAISQMNVYISENYGRYVEDLDQLSVLEQGLISSKIVSKKSGKTVNPIQEVWEKYDVIAYDESVYQSEVKENPATPRYLGLAVNGSTLVPNMSHPIDSWTDGRTYEYYNWVTAPWGIPKDSVKGSKGQAVPKSTYKTIRDTRGVSQLPFDGLASAPFEDKIREGLKLSYYNGKSLWGPGCENITWSEYVHIIQVPTLFSPGLGIMFNQFPNGDGVIYYKSMTLPADNGINLTISNLQVDQNITANQPFKINFTVTNNSQRAADLTAQGGATIPVAITIGSDTYEFSIQGSDINTRKATKVYEYEVKKGIAKETNVKVELNPGTRLYTQATVKGKSY